MLYEWCGVLVDTIGVCGGHGTGVSVSEDVVKACFAAFGGAVLGVVWV